MSSLELKRRKYGNRVKEERANFLFLDNGSLVYDYDRFISIDEAIVDAVVNFGEELDDMIAHCYDSVNSSLRNYFEQRIAKYPKKKFPRLERFMEDSQRYFPTKDVLEAAEELLDFLESNQKFQNINNRLNTDQDVRDMSDRIVDKQIEENYIDIDSDGSMEMFNVLTDSQLNKVLKDDLFANIRKK